MKSKSAFHLSERLLLIFSSFSFDFGKLGNSKFPGHVYNTIFVKWLDMHANRPTYHVSSQHLYLTSRWSLPSINPTIVYKYTEWKLVWWNDYYSSGHYIVRVVLTSSWSVFLKYCFCEGKEGNQKTNKWHSRVLS